jgi:hypothetical protein
MFFFGIFGNPKINSSLAVIDIIGLTEFIIRIHDPWQMFSLRQNVTGFPKGKRRRQRSRLSFNKERRVSPRPVLGRTNGIGPNGFNGLLVFRTWGMGM